MAYKHPQKWVARFDPKWWWKSKRHRNSFISHWMLFLVGHKMENAQMIYTLYACPALIIWALAETMIQLKWERERAHTSTPIHRNVVLRMSVRTHKFSRCMQQRLNRFLFIYCASRSTAKVPKKRWCTYAGDIMLTFLHQKQDRYIFYPYFE